MEKVDANFFRPFVEGAQETVKIMCQTESKVRSPFVKKPENAQVMDIIGLIGLASKGFKGSIAIGFPEKTFLGVMEKMLGEKIPQITKDVEDGAAELLNMIFGHAKRVLNERGYAIEMAIPTIVRGHALEVNHLKTGNVVVFPFDCEFGTFFVEIGINQPKNAS